MADFDSVFEEVGGFGSVQRRIFVLISTLEAPAAWAMFLPVFTHAMPPDWICQQGKILTHSLSSCEDLVLVVK